MLLALLDQFCLGRHAQIAPKAPTKLAEQLEEKDALLALLVVMEQRLVSSQLSALVSALRDTIAHHKPKVVLTMLVLLVPFVPPRGYHQALVRE